MTKDEIQFLMESGFSLNEIIAMGTSAPETSPAAEDPSPIETPNEAAEAPAGEAEQPVELKENPVDPAFMLRFESTVSNLQNEIKKLGDRIAAQGIATGTSERVTHESVDEHLAKIAKKLNGG